MSDHGRNIPDYSDQVLWELLPGDTKLPVYPASLLLEGRPCLVVGGGRVAVRKVEGLLAAGAVVTVVAPLIDDRLASMPVHLERRRYRRGEVSHYRLAFTATGLREVDRMVFDDGESAGVFVNAADDRASCSFHVPSAVRRGAVTVAVSTGGASPALAAWLCARIAEAVGPEYAELAELLARARAEVRARGVGTDTLDWAELIAGVLTAGDDEDKAAAIVEAWVAGAGSTDTAAG